MTQQQFGDYFKIPKRTLQDWKGGKRKIPEYVLDLMEFKVDADMKEKEQRVEQEQMGRLKEKAKEGKLLLDE